MRFAATLSAAGVYTEIACWALPRHPCRMLCLLSRAPPQLRLQNICKATPRAAGCSTCTSRGKLNFSACPNPLASLAAFCNCELLGCRSVGLSGEQ